MKESESLLKLTKYWYCLVLSTFKQNVPPSACTRLDGLVYSLHNILIISKLLINKFMYLLGLPCFTLPGRLLSEKGGL